MCTCSTCGGREVCTCLTCVGGEMGLGIVSSDGAASFFEAGRAGGDCKIVSSLGSKEVAWLILGFLFLLVVPSGVSESWLAGDESDEGRSCSERSCSTVNFGFQLEIEAISADVILPMGLDGIEAVCSADLDGDGMRVSGVGSPRQVQMSSGGVDGRSVGEGAGAAGV